MYNTLITYRVMRLLTLAYTVVFFLGGCSSKSRIEEIAPADVPEFAAVRLEEPTDPQPESKQETVDAELVHVPDPHVNETVLQQKREILLAMKGSGGHYKIGKPYKIDGVWYFPREDWSYDEVGNASWYCEHWHGRRTANGEIFDMDKVSAAHRTLPLPCLARVTNLANGMSLIVRVNDRGPFANDRILDLSRASARLLRLSKYGSATVRVQVLAQESKVLKEELLAKRRKKAAKPVAIEQGMSAEESVDLEHREKIKGFFAKLLAPTEASQQDAEKDKEPKPIGKNVVQVATFTDLDDAQRLAFKIRSEMHKDTAVKGAKRRGQAVFHVRIVGLQDLEARSAIHDLRKLYKVRDAYVV